MTSCPIPVGRGLKPAEFPDPAVDIPASDAAEQVAVLAGGCFWCTEAVYREIDGVLDVVPGYAGGTAETADYRTVCTGATGHAEVIRIRFDARKTSYGRLLKLFFSVAHDPTQLNRQGNDVGRQYRSAVFYADAAQKQAAEAYIRQLTEAGAFTAPIVTTLEPLDAFHLAESYHHDYAARNPGQPYIAHVALPKVDKLRQYFPDDLKA
ncbi:peptide-methionine (S)-S-oxide reductase MsrA [Zavarzinia compransoris]|uniref:Peptide methionine sulfoxide reductase MsrA n=1 Tax=Zavarzinia compransoris TaxID=1264899 RepID=A0A317DY29_9PROT|nr:peptide-methionine (S)-S-oxide reductase MsrA [Zavarzinia compransoris]PWR19569.1 peptide-methionine (S)-S-oxide reductase [Zavarzinia compransoris]TDP40450.1 peptide-methionine (S)-S-oxide reductase [Zavarzinia compransoris]